MSKATNKKKQTQSQTIEFCNGNFYLIPILLVLFLVPLIVRAYFYDSGLSAFNWFPNKTTEELDIFLYWKGVVLVTIAAFMTIILAVKLPKNKALVKGAYWLYPLTGFALLALVSTLFSEYRGYGFTGIYEQFESIWVILAYCVVTVYCYCMLNREEDLRVIKKALFYLLAVLCALGITQLIGKDFFESDLGRRILIPENKAELREGLSFNFSGSGNHQVYLTLYNPNYVGFFTSLILPVTVALTFSAKKLSKNIAWAVISVLLLICTLGSGSKTFLLSLAGIMVLVVIFLRRLIVKHYKLVLTGAVVAVGSCAAYFAVMNVDIVSYMKNALALETNNYALEDVRMLDDHAEFVYNGNELHVQYFVLENGLYFEFTDGAGNEISSSNTENGRVVLNDERFTGLNFAVFNAPDGASYMAAAMINEVPLYFSQTEQGYQYINSCLKPDEIVHADAALFKNHESFATNRGYIWSRTIPLLKKYFILGSGADTFSIVFPQNDYLGRYNAGYNSLLITKPHNLYLQIGVQQGVLALLCFLAVCVLYVVQSCRLYWRADLSDEKVVFGMGIMFGVIGYLISGLANDSSVALAPLFWALLGIGFAVNRMNKFERERADL